MVKSSVGRGMLLHSVDCPEKLCPDCAQGLYGRIVPKDCAQAGQTIIVVSSSARVSEQSHWRNFIEFGGCYEKLG